MLDICDQAEDWITEERSVSEHPFLPLTGDNGDIVLRFEGTPIKEVSNFTTDPDNPKYEWRFTVLHYEEGAGNAPVRKIITESSQNFLAQVTKVTKRGEQWNDLIGVSWKKQKASKSGRWFKNFEMVHLADPQQ